METIHARLRRFRRGKGLTIQEVSQRTGIPASTYKEWENGRQIRGEPYVILAETFEVSLQELIAGRKDKSSSVLGRLQGIEAEIQFIKKDLVALL